jgi:hypothetical protein
VEGKLTEEQLDRVEAMWLRGHSLRAIGAVVGCHHATVREAITRRIVPRWEALTRSGLPCDLARVSLLEERAWQAFDRSTKPQVEVAVEYGAKETTPDLVPVRRKVVRRKRTGEKQWMDVITWCIEFRARVFGYVRQAEASHGEEVRVAGLSPGLANEKMMERLSVKLEEVKRSREVAGA